MDELDREMEKIEPPKYHATLAAVEDVVVQEETGPRAELVQRMWQDSIGHYHLGNDVLAREYVEAAWKLSAGAPAVCAGVTRFVVTDRG